MVSANVFHFGFCFYVCIIWKYLTTASKLCYCNYNGDTELVFVSLTDQIQAPDKSIFLTISDHFKISLPFLKHMHVTCILRDFTEGVHELPVIIIC